MSVVVIPYVVESDEYDSNGVLVQRQGDVLVSHGVDTATGANVVLPCELFHEFVRKYCENIGDEWRLKED